MATNCSPIPACRTLGTMIPLTLATAVSLAPVPTLAAPLAFWASDGWTQFADDEGVGAGGFVDPGWGGQDFDAEYLYYKLDGNQLSLGLQTGFDLIDGKLTTGGKDYYAGDLALSFDGDASGAGGSGFEYGVDFGLFTEGYTSGPVDTGSGTGIDPAGLYQVTAWNNDVYFHASDPFAIDAGTLVANLLSNNAGYDAGADSYYRTVSFDISSLGLGQGFGLDAHWTMSCGNDAIDGHISVPPPASVPAPASSLLLLGGLAGLLARRHSAPNDG